MKTAHLFLDEDFERLNRFMKRQNHLESLRSARNLYSHSNASQSPPGSNIWIIQLQPEIGRNKSYLQHIFQRTPLRLDSYVFGFVWNEMGNKGTN